MTFKNSDLVNKDYVFSVSAGTKFEVVEKNKGGAGKCTFESTHNVIFIGARDNAPVVWCLENRKCAEAAFCVVHSDSSSSLHIVEMKSSLTRKEFEKVIEQISGMYLSAIATISIIEAPQPANITAYVAYKADNISTPPSATLITSKTLVGGAELPGAKEWRTKEITLPHGSKAKLVVGQRVAGDFDFGTVV
ncbi:hypothetical protein [Leisingera caerulea]|uniref:Uncharacterized protein n=1 Tax=Leisingera caerulea TaxID=506591 RepID=A0A9Q9M048_LEICA|nr:hypothetical protein [Leisingera caerulea]UWQ53242.1 hypothetical protein K3721_14775 [Leisingera caerulea]